LLQSPVRRFGTVVVLTRTRATAAAPAVHGAPLHFEQALQLLAHAGQAPPPGEPSSPAWQQAMIDKLVELSSRDALTGLANRRAFEMALEREVDRVARSGEPALLLALDIDHFKRVNDNHGHAAGDQVIQAVAHALLDSVRPMDLVARVGGEEFAIILPNCASTFGQTVAERIRRRVERMPISLPMELQTARTELAVTISAGGAFAPQWVRSTPALWKERADQQLYQAKQQGRNLVCLEPSAMSVVSVEEKRLLFDSFQMIQDPE
jgi:diguanylate cyclase